MAMEPERWDVLPIPQSRPKGRSKANLKGHEDAYLCVALVVLLVWALVMGLGAVNW